MPLMSEIHVKKFLEDKDAKDGYFVLKFAPGKHWQKGRHIATSSHYQLYFKQRNGQIQTIVCSEVNFKVTVKGYHVDFEILLMNDSEPFDASRFPLIIEGAGFKLECRNEITHEVPNYFPTSMDYMLFMRLGQETIPVGLVQEFSFSVGIGPDKHCGLVSLSRLDIIAMNPEDYENLESEI